MKALKMDIRLQTMVIFSLPQLWQQFASFQWHPLSRQLERCSEHHQCLGSCWCLQQMTPPWFDYHWTEIQWLCHPRLLWSASVRKIYTGGHKTWTKRPIFLTNEGQLLTVIRPNSWMQNQRRKIQLVAGCHNSTGTRRNDRVFWVKWAINIYLFYSRPQVQMST